MFLGAYKICEYLMALPIVGGARASIKKARFQNGTRPFVEGNSLRLRLIEDASDRAIHGIKLDLMITSVAAAPKDHSIMPVVE